MESFTRLDQLSREYGIDDSDQMFGRPRVADGERDAKMDAMANTASRPESLNEHLLGQWALLDIDNPRISSAGELIINYIDEDGYLRTDLNEIAEQQVPPFTPEEMEEALGWVQTLERPASEPAT